MPSLEELPILSKASLWFVYFTIGIEQKTAIFEDSGVGSVKDAYRLELLTGVLEASPTRSQQPSPWRIESEPEGLEIV